MVTTGSKLFFGFAVAAFVAAAAWGWGTDGGLLGVLTLGMRGGAGELAGYTILLFVAIVAGLLGVASSALRDADPEAAAQSARLEAAPAATPPAGASYWPVVGAFGAVLTAIGLVTDALVFAGGLFIVGAVIVEWMVLAWSDRATGDPAVNKQIRNRLMFPFEIPLAGAVGIVGVVFCISRVFLTLDRNPTSVFAISVATVVLLVAFLVAYRPRLSSNLVAGVLVLAAIGVLAGGIIAAAEGEREFEHHGTEHEAEAGEHGDDAEHEDELAPSGAEDEG